MGPGLGTPVGARAGDPSMGPWLGTSIWGWGSPVLQSPTKCPHVISGNRKRLEKCNSSLSLISDLSVASGTMQILPQQTEVSGNEDGPPNDASNEARPGDTFGVSQVHTKPAFESTIYLVNQLVAHFTQDCREGIYFRDKSKEDDLQRRLKKKVYSILLSHRKGMLVVLLLYLKLLHLT